MIIVRSGRHPHEVVLLGMCVLVGIVGLLGPRGATATTLTAFPRGFVILWYIGLIAGGILSLTGIAMTSPITGPGIERIGLVFLAGLWLGYGFAVLGTAGMRGTTFVLMVSGFAAANLIRVRQINRDLKEATSQLGGGDG